MLYLRMIFRQFDWIPKSKLDYQEIPDLSESLEELVGKNFVQDSKYIILTIYLFIPELDVCGNIII